MNVECNLRRLPHKGGDMRHVIDIGLLVVIAVLILWAAGIF